MSTTTKDWRLDAACRGMDPELFYPPDDAPVPEAAAVARRALLVCTDCPVRLLCLADADDYGVWGGTTQTQRRRSNLAARAAQDEELLRRYRGNESLRDLGAAFDLNPTTVRMRLKALGQPLRRPGQQPAAKP